MSRYYKHRKSGPDPIVAILTMIGSAFLALFKWLWNLIVGKKQKKFNKSENIRQWQEIDKMTESQDVIHAEQAVIKADKFFDEKMKEAGALGEKFSDRLRSLEPRFAHEVYQSIWDAHKLRNQISHEVELRVSIGECKSALNKFRRGLQGLGAL